MKENQTIIDFFRFSKIKLLNIFLFFLLYFLLDYEFKNFLVKYYDDQGYFSVFNFNRQLETFIILSISLLFLHLNSISPFKYAVLSFLIIFYLIPNTILYNHQHSNAAIPYSVFFLVFFLSIINIRNIFIKELSIPYVVKPWLLTGLAILMILPFVLAFGFRLNLNFFFLQDIYESRADISGSGNILTGYFQSWLTKIIVPIIFCFGLLRRNFLLILISLALQVYLFMVSAEKSVFFTLFIVFVLVFFKDYSIKISFLLLTFIIGIILSMNITRKSGNLMPEAIMVERTFFDPAQMTDFYFREFAERPLALSHSISGKIFSYHYKDSPERIISEKYCNSPNGNANNGLISDGFMNFGFWGIALWIIIFIFIINIFDVLRFSSRFFGVFFVALFTFLSSFLLTTLITHGVLLLIFISVFFLREEKNQNS